MRLENHQFHNEFSEYEKVSKFILNLQVYNMLTREFQFWKWNP